jgi:hypothetical protein
LFVLRCCFESIETEFGNLGAAGGRTHHVYTLLTNSTYRLSRWSELLRCNGVVSIVSVVESIEGSRRVFGGIFKSKLSVHPSDVTINPQEGIPCVRPNVFSVLVKSLCIRYRSYVVTYMLKLTPVCNAIIPTFSWRR